MDAPSAPSHVGSGSVPPSPSSRSRARLQPFTLAIPPHPAGLDQGTLDAGYSRPSSPSFIRSVVVELHGVLYGGRGRDRRAIQELVSEAYDSSASELNLSFAFENPATSARGQEQITDLFCLLGLVPGEMWTELGEICESQSYDGTRTIIIQHTIYLTLLPGLDAQAHSTPTFGTNFQSFYSYSAPQTPYSTEPNTPGPEFQFATQTHTVEASEGASSWPLASLLSKLGPKAVARRLTTVHLKLHSRLVFNELGKIIQHEDTWGLKELIESLPLAGTVYAFNRTALGYLASTASKVLLRKPDIEDDPERRLSSGLGMSMGTPHRSVGRGSHVNGSPTLMRKSLGINTSGGRQLTTSVDPDEDGAAT
ncbi:hypothetical protein MNV49_004291 [Pseudohyphozyma bogoriensis]|nr:hypothetical protein MNV49_004291 [Pseudohyphozyma bogoriensis]